MLDRPLGELAEPDVVVDHLLNAVDSEAFSWFLDRHLKRVVAVDRARAEEHEDLLGDWVPDEVFERWVGRLNRPFRLDLAHFSEVVNPEFMQKIIAGALAETMERFFEKLPAGGGLLSSLARGAGRVSNKIGGNVQQGVKKQLREFAMGSAGLFKEGIQARLGAEENAAELEATRERFLASVLAIPVTELYEMLKDPGIEVIQDDLNALWSHNARRTEVRTAVEQQIRAFLERDQDLTARQILKKHGVLPALRNDLIAHLTIHLSQLAQTEEFQKVLKAVLDEASTTPPDDVEKAEEAQDPK
jgi:hypothetical protein